LRGNKYMEIELKGNELKINAKDWSSFTTIEDSREMMEFVMNRLVEMPEVERVTISEYREIEYPEDQVRMLKEIANIYNFFVKEKKVLSLDFFPQYNQITKELINLLLSDPILCYAKSSMYAFKNPEAPYTREFLLPLKGMLERSRLIEEVREKLDKYILGSRELYRAVFIPTMRPIFMLSRFFLFPPKGSELIEKYYLKDRSEVSIYKVPNKIRLLYFVLSKEFSLSEEKYSLLNEARAILMERKMEEKELRDLESVRKVFIERGRAILKDLVINKRLPISPEEIEELAEILVRYTVGFGILEILLADDKIQDIYVNAPPGISPIFINHADYGECETNLIVTSEEAEAWATRFRLYSGRPLDEANPVLDTEITLPVGRARVAAVTRTLSSAGLGFAFRRHRESPWTFPLFIKVKYFNPLFAGLMSFIIDGGRAVLVAGGRGSGKTSLLSAMILELMRRYRIIIQEDTPEIPVEIYRKLGYNVLHLKSRSVITHVETELAPEEALRTALRLGDSALIVGEVRSKESTVLFEAMRIGALANLVAGTIHGESAYGVYDRVVHDLGLVPTSFKALDIIVIANVITSPDGLRRFRRVTEVVEIRKKWKEDPMLEGAFVPLMTYSAKEDTLKPTDVLLNGESEVLNEIAKRVREWHGAWDRVWDNILLRAKIKQTMVEFAEKLNKPELLEAEWVVNANEAFHLISERVSREVGYVDSKLVYEKWLEWLKEKLK
jgi:type IV secretory pathway ATPase VirB11/archaellum biosynthesis ATPase